MTIEQARAKLGDLVIAAMNGQPTTITRYGRPAARIVPVEEPAMTSITLVSATQGDIVPGVEISDPDSPIEWADLDDAARQWAEQQGYGDDDSELLYVLTEGQEPPDGFPTLTIEEATYRRDEDDHATTVVLTKAGAIVTERHTRWGLTSERTGRRALTGQGDVLRDERTELGDGRVDAYLLARVAALRALGYRPC